MSGLFTRPVTDAERRAWQRRGYDLLGDLLEIGREKDLPVLSWQVSEFSLVGAAHQTSEEQRRAAYKKWADALQLTRRDEITSIGGCTSLRATAADWDGRRVDVAVTADVWDLS